MNNSNISERRKRDRRINLSQKQLSLMKTKKMKMILKSSLRKNDASERRSSASNLRKPESQKKITMISSELRTTTQGISSCKLDREIITR